MKNLIICVLFSSSFLMGANTFAYALDGVTIVTVYNTKTGQTSCSFELPKEYQSKANSIEILVTENKGNVVYSVVTSDLNVVLPSDLSGTYYVTVKIDEYIATQKITI